MEGAEASKKIDSSVIELSVSEKSYNETKRLHTIFSWETTSFQSREKDSEIDVKVYFENSTLVSSGKGQD